MKLRLNQQLATLERALPRKWVRVKGWKDAKAAENIILSAIQLYKEKFEK